MPSLFDPVRLGAIAAPNRIVMAAMTRARGTRDHVPTPLMAEYYAQRAGAGLIISEAIGISQQGLGWAYATGLWSREQVAGWRRVTEAVHAAGGRIVAQLWHMGRTVHPDFIGGAPPVSASATIAPGTAHTYAGRQGYARARALGLDEITGIVEDYGTAARNALLAGFDGVQIHAANGYLVDQFLCDGTNARTDGYGGPIPNRIRLLREVLDAVIDGVGAERTGVRLSPNTETQGVRDSDPVSLYSATAQMLSMAGIAFMELREPPVDGTFGVGFMQPLSEHLRPLFTGSVILNSDFDGPRAQAALDTGIADAVAFARAFLANPDLPARLGQGLPLANADPATWYTQGTEGYTNYAAAS